MEWNKYTVITTDDNEELIVSLLMDAGITGVEIEDNIPVSPEESGNLFGDVVPEMPVNDHRAAVSFYVDASEDDGSTLERFRELLDSVKDFIDTDAVRIEKNYSKEEDWINNWKKYFHRFSVGDILIVPTWERDEAESEGRKIDMVTDDGKEASMLLYIDPGTAFGTGKHESTQLIINRLGKYAVPGGKMLDIGTGSGILGIIALKYGMAHVTGTDIDPVAFPALEDNLKNNGISTDELEALLGDVITDEDFRKTISEKGGYDLITANIIAEILENITPLVPDLLVPGGTYIMSGILDIRLDMAVSAAKRAGLEIVEINEMGEWRSVVCRKNN